MATGTGLPSVRAHADSVIKKMKESGAIAPDANAAALAGAVPSFSRGTATLDPNTGDPIVPGDSAPPPFTDGGVAMPADAPAAEPIAGPEGTAKTAQELIAEHAARVAAAAGAPAPESAAPQNGAAPIEAPASAPASPQTGAAAAEAAAEAVADRFAEFEEFEYEDPDLEVKIPVRVPKNYAQTAKRGYGRRAALDRMISYYKSADPVLRQLVEDGRINAILPLLQRALTDPAYGEYVTQGYERAQRGLPLMEAARAEAAAAASSPTVPGGNGNGDFDPSAFIAQFEAEDPFAAERLKPLIGYIENMGKSFAQLQAERTTATQRQQQEAEQRRRRGEAMAGAHQDLAATYPDLFNLSLGTKDPAWKKALQVAQEAGYVDRYGDLRAAIVFGGQAVAAMEAERVAATASPTAAALAAGELRNMDLARQQAAAASRTVGAGAPTHAPPPAPPQRPTTMMPDGRTAKPAAQYLAEMQQYIAAGGRV
jgi:hypothetical protein